jgi:hypothetical protein
MRPVTGLFAKPALSVTHALAAVRLDHSTLSAPKLSNNIIQKGLAFGRHCHHSGRYPAMQRVRRSRVKALIME